MPISPFQVAQLSKILQAYCDARVPLEARDQVEVRFRFQGLNVFLFERRLAWDHPGEWVEAPVAKFRYYVERQEWGLYWRDRANNWHPYDLIPASPVFEILLKEVDSDPTRVFWG